jgi:hypothetical protein
MKNSVINVALLVKIVKVQQVTVQIAKKVFCIRLNLPHANRDVHLGTIITKTVNLVKVATQNATLVI